MLEEICDGQQQKRKSLAFLHVITPWIFDIPHSIRLQNFGSSLSIVLRLLRSHIHRRITYQNVSSSQQRKGYILIGIAILSRTTCVVKDYTRAGRWSNLQIGKEGCNSITNRCRTPWLTRCRSSKGCNRYVIYHLPTNPIWLSILTLIYRKQNPPYPPIKWYDIFTFQNIQWNLKKETDSINSLHWDYTNQCLCSVVHCF